MRISAEQAHNRWHPEIDPVARVEPGEEITLETLDGLAGQLTPESAHADAAAMNRGQPHPLTGPLVVEGAEPGDLLAVDLIAYETADFGVTAIIPGFGFLADIFTEPYVVKWELRDGIARSAEVPGVALPGDPFAGVVGVAPSHELLDVVLRRERAIAARGFAVADEAPEDAVPSSAAGGLRTIPPRELGGNLDVRGLVAGSRLYLPVHVPDALFSIGDIHFAQGDGEVCGTGIETAGAVTVRFAVEKGVAFRSRFPFYETPPRPGRPRFATMGIPVDDPMDLNAAARAAVLELIDYLETIRGLERRAAYALCSVAADLHISEAVDVPYPIVSALLPLDIFEDTG